MAYNDGYDEEEDPTTNGEIPPATEDTSAAPATPAGPSAPPAWMTAPLDPSAEAMGMNTRGATYADELGALKSALAARQSADPTGHYAYTPNSPELPGLLTPAPGVLASKEDLAATYVNPADRQRAEILNEARAKNEADEQFGGPEAARALQRAMAARQGMQLAGDESQLTQEHEQVTKNALDDFLARQQPKEDTANAANAIKLQIQAMQNAGKLSVAQAQDLSRTADALYGAGAKVAASGFGSTDPGAQMLDQIRQALGARQGGAGTPAGGFVPAKPTDNFAEGATANKGAYVWHVNGPQGKGWYPAQGAGAQ